MIRNARAGDAADIAEIWNPLIRNSAITFNPVEKADADIVALIDEAHAGDKAFLVAEGAGRVLGFARYFQFRAGLGYARCMEHTIYMDASAQGQGLGRALITALEDHAQARGLRMLIGALTATNTASIVFHQRMGFAEVGRIADAGWKFDRYHDLVLMQKLLCPAR